MSFAPVATLERGWHVSLSQLVEQTEQHLLVAAPFITTEGSRLVVDKLSSRLRSGGRLQLLTDLSPAHVCDGSLDPAAIGTLYDAVISSALWHIPGLHAKVYVSDGRQAIVTSGNLTASALYRNVEYGVHIRDEAVVRNIIGHFAIFEALGATVSRAQLQSYVSAAAQLRQELTRVQRSASAVATRAFRQAMRRAEDDLIRMRLAGGAMHTVFARTIAYLLRVHGPMSTVQMHRYIQELHPDLCDNSIDRVIDGKHFGKKWKHAVRTAQQALKKRELVEYSSGLWRPTPQLASQS
jgi:phosphatidylserine/phosphatidylglycerophosphate/cardiolipin synthase-like enzyme